MTPEELSAYLSANTRELISDQIIRQCTLPDGVEILSIGGQTMGASAVELVDVIQKVVQQAQGHVIIDLAQCTYLSSLIIGMLVEVSIRAAEQDRQLIVASANSNILKLFEMIGAGALFRQATSTQTALQELGVLAEA